VVDQHYLETHEPIVADGPERAGSAWRSCSTSAWASSRKLLKWRLSVPQSNGALMHSI